MIQPDRRICIISGAAPNIQDAVGDFAWLLAKELSNSYKISFIIPEYPGSSVSADETSIEVYPVIQGWSIETSRQIQTLVKKNQPDVVLVHYVPQLYGWSGAKPYFALLLRALKNDGFSIVTIAHEFSSPFSTSPKLMLLATAHRALLRIILNASKKVVFTNALYLELVKNNFKKRGKDFYCIPVGCPSPVLHFDEQARQDLRNHLGIQEGEVVVSTFGSSINSVVVQLKQLFVSLVSEFKAIRFLLLGKSGEELSKKLAAIPELKSRLLVSGCLSGEEISKFLSISDFYTAFYPDGASTRRTSLVLGLAHALPIVSNKGILTDPLIEASQAIQLLPAKAIDKDLKSVGKLMTNTEQRKMLAHQAQQFFEENFTWNIIGQKYKQVIESCLNE